MPEWLVEKGIGETRAALVDDGRILEARIELDESVPAGTILEARLVDVGSSGRNGVARATDGTEYLLPHVPAALTEGATFNIEVTRPQLPGPEPWKRPLAKATRDERRRPRSLPERLRSSHACVRMLDIPTVRDELAEADWGDIIEQARSGEVPFDGGMLRIFTTPAMTLVDVDGWLAAAELAKAGACAAGRAIRLLDIGGSVGIDLPTVRGKEARAAAAQALDDALPQPFERTAVNGFGFLQLVRPRPRPSLLELAADRAGFEARALLRWAAFDGAGAKRLVAAQPVIDTIAAKAEWLDCLSRQVGGAVNLRAEPRLPMHGGYAEEA